MNEKTFDVYTMYSFQSFRFFFSSVAAYNIVIMNADDRDVLYLVDWLVILFNFFFLWLFIVALNVCRNDNIRWKIAEINDKKNISREKDKEKIEKEKKFVVFT